MARIAARDAALRTATDGIRWVCAGDGVTVADLQRLEAAVGLAAVQRAQSGLLSDLDAVADELYGRPNSGASS
jgi:hypothetical protein